MAQLALAFVLGLIVGIAGTIYLGYIIYKKAKADEEKELASLDVMNEAAGQIALALLEREQKANLN